MLNSNKSNNSNRRACAAKKNAVIKVECDGCKRSANFFWPAAMQIILFAAKSLLEEYLK